MNGLHSPIFEILLIGPSRKCVTSSSSRGLADSKLRILLLKAFKVYLAPGYVSKSFNNLVLESIRNNKRVMPLLQKVQANQGGPAVPWLSNQGHFAPKEIWKWQLAGNNWKISFSTSWLLLGFFSNKLSDELAKWCAVCISSSVPKHVLAKGASQITDLT